MEKQKQKFLLLLISGVILIIIGISLVIFKREISIETLRTLQTAQETAAVISAHNQRNLFLHMARMFCFGSGGFLTVFGAIGILKKK